MKDELFRLAGEFLLSEESREDRRMLMLKVLKGLVMVFALGMAFVAGKVSANDLPNPTPIDELFDQAVKLGGYEEKCKAREGGCPIPGVLVSKIPEDHIAGRFSWHDPSVISVTTTDLLPGSLSWNETIVHEFVHYLQWLTGTIGPSTPCEGMRDAEIEAYAVGAKYLKQFGVVKNRGMSMLMLATMCIYY